MTPAVTIYDNTDPVMYTMYPMMHDNTTCERKYALSSVAMSVATPLETIADPDGGTTSKKYNWKEKLGIM